MFSQHCCRIKNSVFHFSQVQWNSGHIIKSKRGRQVHRSHKWWFPLQISIKSAIQHARRGEHEMLFIKIHYCNARCSVPQTSIFHKAQNLLSTVGWDSKSAVSGTAVFGYTISHTHLGTHTSREAKNDFAHINSPFKFVS